MPDDFDDLPNRLPPVFEETHHRQLLDDFTLRALRHQAKQVPGTPQVFPLVMRNHPMWTGNNELGQEQGFAPDINNRQIILKLNEWGFPRHWTVCLGLYYDTTLYDAGNVSFGVVALIDFGVGGTMQYVEMDWLNGNVITLPMNALSVIAQYAPGNDEGGDVALPLDLRLRVTVCQGNVSSSKPTRSFIGGEADLNLDDSLVFPVPPFAKSVNIFTITNPTSFDFFSNTTDFVQFLSAPPTLAPGIVAEVLRTEFRSYVNVAEGVIGGAIPVPIPDGARFLRINQASGGGAFAGLRVQYNIGL